jgi:hypothetical protein
MSEIEFESIKQYFDELDDNYEKRWKEEQTKEGRVSHSWVYSRGLLASIKNLIKGYDIENLKTHKISIMGRDNPTKDRDRVRIFVLPKRHSISGGVYLMISKPFEEENVTFRFTYSDKNKPSPQIMDLIDAMQDEYGDTEKISHDSIDEIAKTTISKFIELSIEKDFESMKVQGKTAQWAEYVIPNMSSLHKDKSSMKESITTKNKLMAIPSNFILYGPPGTGKTYKTVDISAGIIGGTKDGIDSIDDIIHVDKNKNLEKNFHNNNTKDFDEAINDALIHFVTFHQNYSYEEFVGGLRPDQNTQDKLRFKWQPGIFIRACANALKLAAIGEPDGKGLDETGGLETWFLKQCNENYSDFKDDNKYNYASKKVVLIIDEINRANISRVFGELITLIESDKRIGAKHQLILTLPNGQKFGVPKNLIILGTMNTADKSLALLDVALRRRFEFIGLFPNEDLVKKDCKNLFEVINNNILNQKGRDFQIGHSYFMEGDTKDIINGKVLPLLNEYFMGDNKKIMEVFKDNREDDNKSERQNGIEEKDGILKYVGEVDYKDSEQ